MEWALFTDLVFGKEGERASEGKEVSVHVLQGNVSVWQATNLLCFEGCLHVRML